MKIMLSTFLALVCSSAAAPAITVVTPANGARVSSPFEVVASTKTCHSVPAVSMGYSLDHGLAIIEPTSFSAMATATPGAHTLHVKCWGKQTHREVLLRITVEKAGSPVSDITVTSPLSGAKVSSPFKLVANSSTCDSVPAVAMGYEIDDGATIIEPASFSAMVTASSGNHILKVKCWGSGRHNQADLSITIGSRSSNSAATPQFSVPSGQYTSRQVVSIADATPGATIYYTSDGSGPTTSSPRYAGPISVVTSTVIEALAVAPGYSNSGLARASYTIAQSSQPYIPANALHNDQIQTLPRWRIKHDPATGGSANGSMNMVNDPSLSGQAARYDTDYSNYGGVLYSVTYGKDPNPANFVYDAEVWIEAGSQIGNLEMDNNQVIANGDTVIYAFQCAGDTNTWDYSENAGTRKKPVVRWVRSNAPCNPATWTQNSWHHVQISCSRDDAGNVTYHSVWLDGIEAPINQTVMSAFSLRWRGGDLIANFQVDGPASGGSSRLYLDNFTIYRW